MHQLFGWLNRSRPVRLWHLPSMEAGRAMLESGPYFIQPGAREKGGVWNGGFQPHF